MPRIEPGATGNAIDCAMRPHSFWRLFLNDHWYSYFIMLRLFMGKIVEPIWLSLSHWPPPTWLFANFITDKLFFRQTVLQPNFSNQRRKKKKKKGNINSDERIKNSGQEFFIFLVGVSDPIKQKRAKNDFEERSSEPIQLRQFRSSYFELKVLIPFS